MHNFRKLEFLIIIPLEFVITGESDHDDPENEPERADEDKLHLIADATMILDARNGK